MKCSIYFILQKKLQILENKMEENEELEQFITNREIENRMKEEQNGFTKWQRTTTYDLGDDDFLTIEE